ncbi:Major cardiolipin synthase ClsA [compost metagenome]
MVLIDNEISAIGSANLDNRSFRLNFEVMLLTVDRTFSDQVEAMLIHDFNQAREISAEDSKDTHRLQQLGMRIARLISPIL